jgi:hypothetical protein
VAAAVAAVSKGRGVIVKGIEGESSFEKQQLRGGNAWFL